MLKRGGFSSGERLADALIERTEALSSATMHEAAGRIGALPAGIRALDQAMHCAGRALPVRCPRGDNLWIHHALEAAEPGDVLVIDAGDGAEYGYWGEIMATMAIARKVAGIVISGGVRDSLRLIELGLPTFSASISILGTGKDNSLDGAVGEPVRMGETVVRSGDLVIGDADGVAVFPAAMAADLIDASEVRDAKEIAIIEQLQRGASTLEVYNFD